MAPALRSLLDPLPGIWILAVEGSLVMYFQHYDGSIRYLELTSDLSREIGGLSEVVVTDAKSVTALSAVACAWNGISTLHIFFKPLRSLGLLRRR